MALDIRLVKLVNGDMVIGKWDLENRKIQDPAILQTVPTAQGEMQMMLLPYGYPFDNDIDGEISIDHVIYEYKSVPEELKTKYLEASSNLTISSASDLRNLENFGNGSGISDLLRK
ncbi:MAG: hypothetical protein PHO79_02385 [Desulfoplanes sp.]|nr:hypothetical protein [Desulfoplanes sp.]